MVAAGGGEAAVCLTDSGSGVAVGDEVDRLRGATTEHDFGAFGSVDERGDTAAGTLVGEGRLLAEEVHAAMDVRVVFLVLTIHGIDDGTRLLRRGGVVAVADGAVSHRSTV